MKAMIFAAGLGTRLKPLTDDRPKALAEISGKTLLQRCIENLKRQGISDVVINVHHFSTQIISFLKEHNNFGLHVQISDESSELLETGGGLLKARPLLMGDQPILIINVDVLTDLDFQKLEGFHQHEKALATLVVRRRKTSRYLMFDTNRQLTGWKNLKSGTTKVCRMNDFENSNEYAFSGIQLIQPELLDLITETGRFSIINLYLRLAEKHSIKAFVDEQSNWMDLGKYEQLEEAKQLIQKQEEKKKPLL
ncbi:MAG TPA: nucleotidyltransferase family protein [Sunxiuqinia sp.]|nr:nucleotidyltransferase family protein [Sunxiuqinia sp.]